LAVCDDAAAASGGGASSSSAAANAKGSAKRQAAAEPQRDARRKRSRTSATEDVDAVVASADPAVLARFLHAVKELRFMGFIRPSGRSGETIARAVYELDTW
jgi:hypothetical protein